MQQESDDTSNDERARWAMTQQRALEELQIMSLKPNPTCSLSILRYFTGIQLS